MQVAWKRKVVRFLEGQIDYIGYILIASDKDEAVMRLVNYSHLSHWGWIFIIHMELFSLCVLKVKRFRRREEYKYEANASIQVMCHIKPQIASFPH